MLPLGVGREADGGGGGGGGEGCPSLGEGHNCNWKTMF